MSNWSEQDLAALSRVSEIRVAGRRQDRSPRKPVIIWHVVVDGTLYVRSVYGVEGQWYKGVLRYHEGIISWDGQTHEVTYTPDSSADDAIDAAYFAKYGNGSAN